MNSCGTDVSRDVDVSGRDLPRSHKIALREAAKPVITAALPLSAAALLHRAGQSRPEKADPIASRCVATWLPAAHAFHPFRKPEMPTAAAPVRWPATHRSAVEPRQTGRCSPAPSPCVGLT